MPPQNETNATAPGERPINDDLAKLLIESLKNRQSVEGTDEPPRAATALVSDAIRQRATDIHLDTDTRGLRVRFRIDGVMHDAALLAPQEGSRLVNQFKSLVGLDPVAQFSADEARVTLEIDDEPVDLRLAIIPCLHGQKLTVRVLDPRQLGFGLNELGMSEESLDRVQHWFQSLGGIFLVAGPVGSGKTTTLYALLHALKLQACSVSTLEDPVEYSIDGVNQIQIDEEHGLTFAEGITALARHDPDVILVGELRDRMTAQAAYGAAALGRTILTTLHARDAAGAVTSLRYYGLDDRDIATTLSVVMAQRLVRMLCPNCRRETPPSDEEKRWFGFLEIPVPESSWEPVGCERCGQSGYHGRTGVFEVWRPAEDDYHLLLAGGTEREIRNALAERGEKHFLADALEKAEAGVTSLAEVQRLHLAGPSLKPKIESARATVE